MVITGVSGELHQIGANVVADATGGKSMSSRNNLPHSAVLAPVEENSADVRCISTTCS
jgi:methanogenic corrinoid protein MtbC1